MRVGPTERSATEPASTPPGIRPNLGRFLLLVAQVAFVGALWGTERTVLPLIAKSEFGIASATSTLSFILAFGLTKAPANFIAGRLADRFGRRRLLIGGWLLGIPVPLLIAFAPSWSWVIVANLLLGAQQGICWSTAIFMKVDVSGKQRSGLAIGINEFAGYGGTAVLAYASGAIAASMGPRVAPFLLGEAFVLAGLATAWWLGQQNLFTLAPPRYPPSPAIPTSRFAFGALCQAGFVVKLGDTLVWGLLPSYFQSHGLPVATVAVLAAAYPASWAVLQPFTGAASDRLGRRGTIIAGMLVQAVGLGIVALSSGFGGWLSGLILLGAGTAMTYPVLIAAAGDTAHLHASRIGHYRFWRDMGFVAGALLIGQLSDRLGVSSALHILAVIPLVSGLLVAAALRRRATRA